MSHKNDEVRRKLRDITVNQAAIEVLDSFLDKLSRSEESDFEKASEENNLAGQFLSIAIRQHIIRIKEQNRDEKAKLLKDLTDLHDELVTKSDSYMKVKKEGVLTH